MAEQVAAASLLERRSSFVTNQQHRERGSSFVTSERTIQSEYLSYYASCMYTQIPKNSSVHILLFFLYTCIPTVGRSCAGQAAGQAAGTYTYKQICTCLYSHPYIYANIKFCMCTYMSIHVYKQNTNVGYTNTYIYERTHLHIYIYT